MKKICINCFLCDVANADKEYGSIAEMMEDDDYLICLLTNQKTDDNSTCKKWTKSKLREADLKAGC